MAGDWIKMRNDLSEDPAVIEIAARLGVDEFAIVGRLQCLWAWADGQSRDGHARGVTAAWIDRKVQRDGFAQTMCDVGWLTIDEEGVTFPNFERHNGETAKTRALGANRQKKKRAGNAVVTEPAEQTSRNERDKSVTREEKRREEKKEHSEPNGSGAGAPPDSADVIFGLGVPLLTAANVADKSARSMLGLMRKTHSDEAVIEALQRCAAEKPMQPVSWLQAALKSAAPTKRKSDALMAGNIAAAQRFLETQ